MEFATRVPLAAVNLPCAPPRATVRTCQTASPKGASLARDPASSNRHEANTIVILQLKFRMSRMAHVHLPQQPPTPTTCALWLGPKVLVVSHAAIDFAHSPEKPLERLFLTAAGIQPSTSSKHAHPRLLYLGFASRPSTMWSCVSLSRAVYSSRNPWISFSKETGS